ncbi:MAG: hypothetical protein Q7J34_11600 [Bacteroidales bacterium]|nr:hypothetical protein [Bacteroidales bacterium]
MHYYRLLLTNCLLLISIFSCLSGFAEGTREIQPTEPTPGQQVALRAAYENTWGTFATPVAPATNRLQFTIASTTEIVYFGFQNSGTTNYAVKDSVGNTLLSGLLPTSAPNPGYISTFNEAVAGPKPVNPAGYQPLIFNPPFTGHFYIEFWWSPASGTRIFNFFDVSVCTPANIEIKGRVWSKNWQINCSPTSKPFMGTMFPYTNDRVVTSIGFNGMAPALFTVACNPTGCDNTGNFINDRKSRTGNVTYPEYKIFLNDPDINVFPTGVLGGVDSITTDNHCNGDLDFLIYVNKSGVADILLNINPLPGVQPEDINLSDSVINTNVTVITWDGLDGLGNPVPSGTTISIEVTYINGLTHLPMYDVEYSATTWKGFIVDLIRPAGTKPKVFWDDSMLPGGTVNLDGCVNPVGCHSWGNSVGNVNTVNTWWFALSTSITPFDVVYRRNETRNYYNTICEGDSIHILSQWISVTDILYDSTYNIMGCDSVNIYHVLSLPASPLDLGPDTLICNGESVIFDAGASPDIQGYLWNTSVITQTITATTTGTYSCLVTYFNGCQKSNSVELFVSDLPPPLFINHD